MTIINGLSIDLEEYFHAENVKAYFSTNSPSRVQESTIKILNLLESKNIKATFFILGQVAESHPGLIKTIAASNHEIASHGFNHQLVYQQSPNEFLEDISHSKKLLEDLTSKKVIGYRAPSFSITEKVPWALGLIAEAGYQYDSSIYPIYHPRYANLGKPRFPYKHKDLNLLEVPLATTQINFSQKQFNLPIAGGAYWRLLPISYAKWGLARLNEKEKRSAFTYFHPWELDPQQPPAIGLKYLTKVRHYGGQNNFLKKLEILTTQFKFDTYSSLIQSLL